MEKELINRVADSGLITINLENFYPKKEMVTFDLRDYLFHGLILKEKDFRLALKELDWNLYHDKIVLIICSTDAIIPVWAYMLVDSYLVDIADETFAGTRTEYLKHHYARTIENIDSNEYLDSRVVIKGCSDKPVPHSAYSAITHKLKGIAQSIMYGEPCSTVPITKRPRKVVKD